MRLSILCLVVMLSLASSQDFNVVYDTFDPMIDLSDPRVGLMSTSRAARHKGTGDGIVDAMTICLRFQGSYNLGSIFEEITLQHGILIYFNRVISPKKNFLAIIYI